MSRSGWRRARVAPGSDVYSCVRQVRRLRWRQRGTDGAPVNVFVLLSPRAQRRKGGLRRFMAPGSSRSGYHRQGKDAGRGEVGAGQFTWRPPSGGARPCQARIVVKSAPPAGRAGGVCSRRPGTLRGVNLRLRGCSPRPSPVGWTIRHPRPLPVRAMRITSQRIPPGALQLLHRL
jgi:hypothetical protein